MAELGQKARVDITIHWVKMTFRTPIELNVIWKRKNRRVEIGTKVPIPAGSGRVEVEQTLTMTETLLFSRTGGWQEHSAELYFQALVDRGAKVVGKVVLPIVQSQYNQQEIPIDSCPDTTAIVCLSTTSQSDPDPENLSSDRGLRLVPKRLKLRASPREITTVSLSKDWESLDTNKLQEMNSKISDLETQNKTLNQTVSELKKKLRAVNEEMQSKDDEWESRYQYFSPSDLELQHSKALRAKSKDPESEQQIQEMTQQLTETNAEMKKLRRELRELMEAKLKAEEWLKFEKSQSETYKHAIDDLSLKVCDVTNQRDQLESDLQASKSLKNSASSSEISTLNEKLQEKERKFKQEMEKMQGNERKFKQEIEFLNSEIQRISKENEEIQGTKSQEKSEIEWNLERKIEENHQKSEKEKEKLIEEFETKMNEMETWYRSQIDNLRDFHTEKDHKSTLFQLQETEKTVFNLRNSLKSLENRPIPETKSQNLDAKMTEIEELRSDIDELILALYEEQRNSQKTQFGDDFNSEIFDLKIKSQNLEAENLKLKEKLILAAEKELKGEENARNSKELRELREKYELLETKFTQESVKCGELLNQCNELEEEYHRVVSINQQLGQENQDLRQMLPLKSPSSRKK